MKKTFFPFAVFLLLGLVLSGCVTPPASPTGPQVAVMLVKLPKKKQPQRVVIALRESAAPQTTASFKELANRHYYDGIWFHRLFPHSLVQTGDPKSRHGESSYSGTGGPGYTLPAEIKLPHIKGAVAASRLPNDINLSSRSNGSQFYICLEPMPQLNGQYTVFGQVVEGMEVLDALSTIKTNNNNFPIEKVTIVSLRMEPRVCP